MDFTLSEEQEMLKTMARDFLTDKCPKTVVKTMETDEKGYSPEMWAEMAELGWMGLVFPEKYSGSEMTFLDLSVLLEETGRACLPGPFFSTVVLGGLTLLESGSDAQKQEYLPRIAGGEAIFTMALTEAGGKYDAASIRAKAAASGDGYTISGTKMFVPDASVADYILVVARTDEKAKADAGLTVFLVDARSPGIKMTPLITMANDKQSEVVFDNVKVSKDSIIGGLNRGWEVVEKTLSRATIGKCCAVIGAMETVLDMTVEYAKERKQYGKPIGSFQVLQHYCANMAIDVDGSRFITYQAAWMLSQGLECRREVAAAKAWVNEAMERVFALAHQIHGAIGVTIDHDLQYYTKRAKAAALIYGTADYQRELVAREMGL
jgi:alkylation response protein AidB-like acyl-CoA dehydrogenase